MPPTPPTPAPTPPWPHPFPPPLILPPELPPRRFSLGPVSIGVLALCVCLHLIAGLPTWVRTPSLAAQDIGVFALGFLVTIGLAAVAWKLDSRGRAGGLVFCCLLGLFALARSFESVSANLHDRILRQQAPDQQTRAAALRPVVAAAIPEDPRMEKARREHQQALDRMHADVADGHGGNPRAFATEARFMDELQSKIQDYDHAAARLRAAGGGSAQGLDTLDAIARRRQMVKDCLAANAVLTAAFETTESDLLADLRGVLPEAEARGVTRQVLSKTDQASKLEVRDCERRCLEAVDGQLVILQTEFSRWHLDADCHLTFHNPAAASWAQ